MYELMLKDVEFKRNSKCEEAFQKLKVMLTEATIWGYADLTKRFYLLTDVSGLGIGSALPQKGDDGKKHLIVYASRTLKKYEHNCGITELQLLAIIWSLGHFQPYLLGSKTTMVTDHKENHWILDKKRPKCTISMRLTRWSILVQEYDFDVEYRPGRKHRNAAALSRPPIVAKP